MNKNLNDMFVFNVECINSEEIINRIQEKSKEIFLSEKEKEILYKEIKSLGSESNIFQGIEDQLQILKNKWKINVDYHITSHRPIIGNVIVFFKRIARKFLRWLIIWPFKDQEEFNQNVIHALHKLKESIETLQQEQSELLIHLKTENEVLEKKLNDVIKLHREINLHSCDLKSELREIKATARIANERARRLERWIRDDMNYHQEKQTNLSIRKNNKDINDIINNEHDYYLFHEVHFGSRNQVKERQRAYLNYFKGKTNVVDLGCGRGEFIELLQDEGIPSLGIDRNLDMINLCRDLGLNVEKEDIFSFLERQNNNSLGGVFLGNVIQEIQSKHLIYLINLVYQKLQPNAYFVIESLNPQNLSVLLNSFFFDLSEGKMIHPQTIRFILESVGYCDIKVEYHSKILNNESALLHDDDVLYDTNDNYLNYSSNNYQFFSVISRK